MVNHFYKYYLRCLRISIQLSMGICLSISANAQEASGTQGNTYIGNGGIMSIFANHSFVAGGAGIRPGIIATERTAPFGVLHYHLQASVTDANDANHVDGYVSNVREDDADFTFPIGDAGKLRPVTISNRASGVTYRAAYYFVSPDVASLPFGAPFPVADRAADVERVSTVEYWDIDGSSATNITLTWNADSDLNTLTGGVLSNLAIVGYNPATNKWESLGGTATGTLAGTGSIEVTGVIPDNYAAFTFGTISSDIPDLTVMGEASLQVLQVSETSNIDFYIENIKPTPTTGQVTVTIAKPTSSSGLVLTILPSSDWTIAENSFTVTVTLVGTIAGSDFKSFSATLHRTGGAKGSYNLTAVISNGSGGEINNLNNRAIVQFNKN